MVDDRTLRRLGVLRRSPSRRKLLAIALPTECTDEVVTRLARSAARKAGTDGAAEQLQRWLESGEWRAELAAAQAEDAQADAREWTRDRLAAAAGAHVLGSDRWSLERTAEALRVSVDEVRTLVCEYAIARDIDEERVELALGLREPPPVRVPWEGKPRTDAPPPPPVNPAPRRTPAELRAFYLDHGRRAPAHVLEQLTRPTAGEPQPARALLPKPRRRRS